MTRHFKHPFADCLLQGDCIESLKPALAKTVDLVITDPPYLVNYKDRSGRSIINDDNGDWLKPAFSEIFRVLKNNAFCISFYGWSEVHKFMSTWKAVGFEPVGHIVWHKRYASNSRYLNYKHEQEYLLVKGYQYRHALDQTDGRRLFVARTGYHSDIICVIYPGS